LDRIIILEENYMPIVVTLDLSILPEKIAEAPAGLEEILDVTRTRPGCLGVDLLVDRADPSHILLVEKWASVSDDADYRAFRASPEGASNFGSFLAAPPVSLSYDLN
jgi:quinol monooxygenase YgiN